MTADGGKWDDERIRVWLRFALGFLFLGYFCFVDPEQLKSVPLTAIIGACIFGSAWFRLWRSGRDEDP